MNLQKSLIQQIRLQSEMPNNQSYREIIRSKPNFEVIMSQYFFRY